MYNKLYQNFYTGKNRQEIHRTFSNFIDMIRENNFERLDEVLTKDCVADISMLGHIYGIDEIRKKIIWPCNETNVSKILIFGFSSRTHGDIGSMFSYVQCCRAIETEENIYPFLFGGQFINTLKKEGGKWKINHIKFDMAYEEGNDLFVKDKWITMNYGIYSGHETMINAELDSPWRVIKDDDEPLSDEEEIFELMHKYAFVFDNADFEFMHEFVTDDFWINGGKNELPVPGDKPQNGDYIGLRQVNDFLKSKHKNEAKMIHGCRMHHIEYLEDGSVHAYMPRAEEHRLKNHNPDKESIHSIVTTAIHHIYARKVDGYWKMYKYRITPDLRFTSISDSNIQFDEYVVLGGKNGNI